jgi:hypothetical protein
MKNHYGHDFYADRHQETVYSANTVLSLVLDALPPVRSSIDFGCGLGTWLSVLKEKGICEIQGLDGPWVEHNLLEIPREDFREINFEETITLEKRYDLAITLEVAEHVSQESATSFVESLVRASDFVLFSAAIPFQGGTGHVNEQWPDYWVEIFATRGYVALDLVRNKIWNDKNIPFWYRQNILLFVKKEKMSSIRVASFNESESNFPIALVHPYLYFQMRLKMNHQRSIKGSFELFRQAVRTWIKQRVSKNS